MNTSASPATPHPDDHFRLDKWLWQARFFKSRALAAAVCRAGSLRVNGEAVIKANEGIKVGDVLTIPYGQSVRVVRILAFGERRGPYSEAVTLYQEITANA